MRISYAVFCLKKKKLTHYYVFIFSLFFFFFKLTTPTVTDPYCHTLSLPASLPICSTATKVHTAIRIAPAYEGPVIHVLDASRAVGVASALVSDNQRDGLVARTAEDYEAVRIARASKGQDRKSTRLNSSH